MFSYAICGKQIFTQNPKKFFCRNCYKQSESDILAKTDGVRFCASHEHQRRRQGLKDREFLHLGSEFDVGDSDGDYSLVPEDYYEEWDQKKRDSFSGCPWFVLLRHYYLVILLKYTIVHIARTRPSEKTASAKPRYAGVHSIVSPNLNGKLIMVYPYTRITNTEKALIPRKPG